MHGDGEGETGDGVCAVGGRPGIDRGRHGNDWRAGENARTGVEGQAGGQGPDERVAQGIIAAGGGRQGHGRHDVADDVGQGRHRCHVKHRDQGGFGIGDRDDDEVGGRHAAVATDGVANGGGVVHMVGVPGRRDGDGPGGVPSGGGKGQGRGDGDVASIGTDDRRHRHVAAGGRVQPHGVDRGAALGHDDGGGGENHPGPGRPERQLEAGIEVPVVAGVLGHADEPGSTEHDGRRR